MAEERLRYVIEALWQGKAATVQARRDIGGLKDSGAQSTASLKGMNTALQNVAAGLGGAAAAAAVVKQAWDFSKEGAQIGRVEERFEALNSSIGAMADDTMLRLQNAVDGSVDKLTLMGNANLLLSTGAASTDDELVGLVENIIKLKNPADDAGAAIENFSLLLANKSIPRLDSFGLSASTVRDRYNELKETVDDDTAFKTAVFEQMEVALQKVGQQGDYSADAFTRVEVRLKDATDAFKVNLAEGLEPWVKFVLGDYKRAFGEMARANQDLINDYSNMGWVEKLFAGAEATDEVIKRVAASTDSYREFRDELDRIGVPTAFMDTARFSKKAYEDLRFELETLPQVMNAIPADALFANYQQLNTAVEENLELTTQQKEAYFDALDPSHNYADSQYDLSENIRLAVRQQGLMRGEIEQTTESIVLSALPAFTSLDILIRDISGSHSSNLDITVTGADALRNAYDLWSAMQGFNPYGTGNDAPDPYDTRGDRSARERSDDYYNQQNDPRNAADTDYVPEHNNLPVPELGQGFGVGQGIAAQPETPGYGGGSNAGVNITVYVDARGNGDPNMTGMAAERGAYRAFDAVARRLYSLQRVNG